MHIDLVKWGGQKRSVAHQAERRLTQHWSGTLTAFAPLSVQRSAYPIHSLDEYTSYIYTFDVRFTWREAKRRTNLQDHGFDFADAEEVFAGPTFTFEDARFRYEEQRFVTLGLLKGVCVSLVHTETPERIHIISFRKATRNEQIIFFQNI